MLTLQILRHANAERNSASGRDFDRDLSPEGFFQRHAINTHFKELTHFPEQIFVSSAKRTVTTYEGIREFMKTTAVYSDDLYLASLDNLIDFMEDKASEKSVLLVGHNDGISELVSYLTGDYLSLSTGGYIEMELHIDQWNMLTSGCASVVHHFEPSVASSF